MIDWAKTVLILLERDPIEFKNLLTFKKRFYWLLLTFFFAILTLLSQRYLKITGVYASSDIPIDCQSTDKGK